MEIGNNYNRADVDIQDQASPPFQYYLMREDKTDITLTSVVSPGDEDIEVSAGHGFTVDPVTYISIFDNNRYLQSKVSAVDGNNITLAVPSSYEFSTDSIVVRGCINLNVNAASSNQEFIFNFRRSIIPIDIDTVVITMINDTEPDDSKFGNLTSLPNGVVFRKQNTIIQALGDFRNNSDFRDYGAEVSYTDKAGSGNHGTSIVFDIRKLYGVVIRINPRHSDILKAILKDNLSGLVNFKISILGQYTVNE